MKKMHDFEDIKEAVELCLVPKLSKNYDEYKNHVKLIVRVNDLEKHFRRLLNKLQARNLKHSKNAELIISHILILYYELSSKNKWNNKKCLNLSQKLNYYFEMFYEISLENILEKDGKFKKQDIFDKCIENLHGKLNQADFKKYPTQIDIYINIVKDIKKYNVTIVPSKIFPASLCLIDDYILENKIKGLQCCLSILECLNLSDFNQSNYNESLFFSINKLLSEKDIELTKLVIHCLINLFDLLPENSKKDKLDKMYHKILHELVLESNLFRKVECLKFIRIIIALRQIHCCYKIEFYSVIADNLDLCTDESVSDILLESVLQALEEWIRHCWCVWKLSAGHRILTNLFKVLHCCDDDTVARKIHGLIVTLIKLCEESERKSIVKQLVIFNCTVNNEYLNRVYAIKYEVM